MRIIRPTPTLVCLAIYLSLAPTRAQVLDVNGDATVGPKEALTVAEAWKGPALSGIGESHFLRDFTVSPGETVSAGDIVAFINGTVRKGTGRIPFLTAGSQTIYSEDAVRYLAAAALTPPTDS